MRPVVTGMPYLRLMRLAKYFAKEARINARNTVTIKYLR
jgi:hypothetical protein